MILVVVALVLLLVVGLPLAGFALVSLVGLLLSGLVIGGLGRLLVPGRQPIGLPATVLVGIVGALVGTVVGHEVHLDGLVTVLLEVVAAAVLVVGVARTGLARRLGRSRTRALPRGQ
ncbi:MAG TPA: GlsB/YeaQ/YmgE family stress response membrane protein [Verrucomicrobiae bacterium]|nr:GlsB/YeaQ/YmgE family stress response membrane protein [Verrucomicrobiae bacterium]